MIGGNAGYFLALAVWRMFLQKLKARNIGVSLLMGVLTGGIIMLTIRKEMRILGIISGDYGDLSWWVRIVVGIIYCLISLVFIPCYQFVVFKLKLYPGRKDRYTAYVYHDFFFLFSTGIWCVLALNAMLVAAVVSGGVQDLMGRGLWNYTNVLLYGRHGADAVTAENLCEDGGQL